MIKLVDILHKQFGENTVIDKILSGKLQYLDLIEEQYTALYYEGLHLLHEYEINLGIVYKNVLKNEDVYGIYYSFRNKNNELYCTRITKNNYVKIGPGYIDPSNNAIIHTKKYKSFKDDKLLNTHILNLINYVKEYKPEKLFFDIETSDDHGEGRKKLFLGVAGKMYDFVKDVKVNGDEVTIYLKYDQEGT